MSFVGLATSKRHQTQAQAQYVETTLPRVTTLKSHTTTNLHQVQRPTRKSIIKLLMNKDISITQQRIEIAYILFACEQHLSADQILAALNTRNIKISKATVYNTLKLFLAKKLIRELIIDPAKIFYDRNTTPHHHFYDVETGTLTDIPAEDVRIEGLPPLPSGVVTEGIDIIVRTRRPG